MFWKVVTILKCKSETVKLITNAHISVKFWVVKIDHVVYKMDIPIGIYVKTKIMCVEKSVVLPNRVLENANYYQTMKRSITVIILTSAENHA